MDVIPELKYEGVLFGVASIAILACLVGKKFPYLPVCQPAQTLSKIKTDPLYVHPCTAYFLVDDVTNYTTRRIGQLDGSQRTQIDPSSY